ncbi:phage tail protein [soil metagenome]
MGIQQQFVVNTHRFDPYANFKFRIKWDGRYVAGVSKLSALKRSTDVITHREGGDPSTSRHTPSLWKFEPITVERGITHDPEFEAWANRIYSTSGDAAISLRAFRKDLIIEMLNRQNVVAKAYRVFLCWVSEYTALPELDANGHAIAIERIVLQNEGWERDPSVGEPTEY